MEQYHQHWQIVQFFQQHTKRKQSIRPVAKAHVLTSVEQWKLFQEKVEQKRQKKNIRKNECRKEKRKELRKLIVKKNITEKKKATKEKDSQHDETSKTNEEKLQQPKPARFYESSDSSKDITEESVEEYNDRRKGGTMFFLQKSKCMWIYFQGSRMGSMQPL